MGNYKTKYAPVSQIDNSLVEDDLPPTYPREPRSIRIFVPDYSVERMAGYFHHTGVRINANFRPRTIKDVPKSIECDQLTGDDIIANLRERELRKMRVNVVEILHTLYLNCIGNPKDAPAKQVTDQAHVDRLVELVRKINKCIPNDVDVDDHAIVIMAVNKYAIEYEKCRDTPM